MRETKRKKVRETKKEVRETKKKKSDEERSDEGLLTYFTVHELEECTKIDYEVLKIHTY